MKVFFVGRLIKEKGILDIIQIAKRMPEISFIIAGTGKLQKELVKRSSDNVRILGYVSEEKKKELFESSDVCLFPSHIEPFGLVVLEAMKYRKPIIASKVGGMAEILSGGVGLLVEPEDINGFVKAINVMKDKRVRNIYSKKSLKRVKDFSWDNIAKMTLKFLYTIS